MKKMINYVIRIWKKIIAMNNIVDFNSFGNKDSFFSLLYNDIHKGKKLYVIKKNEISQHIVKRIELDTSNPYVVIDNNGTDSIILMCDISKIHSK
ncbi:MAG: hypothetical protein U0V72_02180 [Cytophagales bacterium]